MGGSASATSSPRTTSPPNERAERGATVGCIIGAPSVDEYEGGLRQAGFVDVSVTFTQNVGGGVHSAIVKATRATDP